MMTILEDDQRGKRDRRELDVGPPYGLSERRWMPERRIPVVEEMEFDGVIEMPPVSILQRYPAARTHLAPGET